jgi:hypothetical protein
MPTNHQTFDTDQNLNVNIASSSYSTSGESISSATAVAAHDTNTVTAGREFLINCTVAGNVKVAFSDASTLTIPVAVGLTVLPWAIIQVFVTGTTATATYANLT